MAHLDFSLVEAINEAIYRNGYILDMKKIQVEDLFKHTLGIDILSEKYSARGSSAEKRFRCFLEAASVGDIAQILFELSKTPSWAKSCGSYQLSCQIIDEFVKNNIEKKAFNESDIIKMAEKVENHPQILAQINSAIKDGHPESALDRLQILIYGYLIHVCQESGIDIYKSKTEKKSLESLAGEYINKLVSSGNLVPRFGEWLKASNNRFRVINDIRNKSSLAHVSPLVPSEEAQVILDCAAADLKMLSLAHRKYMENL